MIDTSKWTYGAELELSDLDQTKGLPEGFGWDKRDVTMVNSNGIAVDPKGISYTFGGEINTKPTNSIKKQLLEIEKVLKFHSNAKVNYRSNLHLHIRVPGLKDSLSSLKKISKYCMDNQGYLDLLEPIPKPCPEAFNSEEEYKGALRRYKRRLISHHKTLNERQYTEQLKAKTVYDFFAAEAPKKDGKPLFAIAPRCAVNLRQLMETDTIEFRHFPGTLDIDCYKESFLWCFDFLKAALGDQTPCVELLEKHDYKIAKFKKYVHWMEVFYRMTVHDGTIKRATIEDNIKGILNGTIKKFKA